MTKKLHTSYKIEKQSSRYDVSLNGRIVAKGLLDVPSAMQAVWALNGKKEEEYYKYDSEKDRVICEISEEQ